MSFLEKIFQFISGLFLALAGRKPKDEGISPEEKLHDLIMKNSPGIGPKMTKMASEWFFHKKVTNMDYLVLVDFDLHESNPRMWVVNRKKGTSEVFKVAHGSNSDPDKDGSADQFSNVSGSHQSSLGAMVFKKQYGKKDGGWSKFDYALKIEGLQKGLNENVQDRAIVFHSSNYVNDVRGKMIGDSWGCFAVSTATAQRIIDMIDDGALLFAYHKSLDKAPEVEGGEHSVEKAVKLIKKWEGFRANSYHDPVGVITIGYGTTVYPNGQKVKMGDFLTEAKATEYLRLHIEKDVLPAMADLIEVQLTENQFNALVSFVYNLGAGNLKRSTLLEKLNQGDFLGAADEFPKWVKAGGKVLQGLVNRRADERALFLEV